MNEPTAATPGATIGGADARRVAIGAAVAAVSSTLVVLASPRLSASAADNTVFLTYWSALFAGFGVLTGVSVETTRAVTSARGTGREIGPRVGVAGLAFGLGFAALLAVGAPWWSGAVFKAEGIRPALLVALGCAGCAVHAATTGALAGAGRWRVYSRLVGGESAMRLLLVVGAGLAGVALVGWEIGAALAASTAVGFLLFSRDARGAVVVRADVPTGSYLRRLLAASVSSGASAVLVIGFPVLLAATSNDEAYALAAPLLLALTLTRAPLMIPLNAFQGVAVSHFVQHRDRGPAALLPIARIVLPVGVTGGLAAWLIGPTLLRWIGGPDYHVGGVTLGLLTLAATGLAMVTLTGAVCQALARHGVFVAGWLAAVAVAVGVLLLPYGLEARTVAALLAGPLVGIAVHLTALRPRGGSA
ncbi:hypothetical protein [Cellulomonas sp. NPDC089187]|uniref:hypothetical protein n=1 Tax=Cellulomonas sp. NPDC089187 TaxID=3154970 RepID=UPI003437545E